MYNYYTEREGGGRGGQGEREGGGEGGIQGPLNVESRLIIRDRSIISTGAIQDCTHGENSRKLYDITNLKIIIMIFAGYYGTSGGENVPCLVYSTFSNRVFIYHNIKLPSVASTNLITAMQNKVQPH